MIVTLKESGRLLRTASCSTLFTRICASHINNSVTMPYSSSSLLLGSSTTSPWPLVSRDSRQPATHNQSSLARRLSSDVCYSSPTGAARNLHQQASFTKTSPSASHRCTCSIANSSSSHEANSMLKMNSMARLTQQRRGSLTHLRSTSSMFSRNIITSRQLNIASENPNVSQIIARADSTSTRTTSSVTATTSQAHSSSQPPVHMANLKSNFCRMCGGPITLAVHSQEGVWRHACGACGYVDYFNPKIVVGAIVEHEGKVLLCRRAIQPCRGLWTVPAGFLELGESCIQGAVRETREEAGANIEVVAPYAQWDIPAIGQAYMLYRARLAPPHTFESGPESLECRLFSPAEIPYDQIAFSSVATSLRFFLEDMASGRYRIHQGVIDKQPGSGPNDPATFALKDHLQMHLAA